MKRFGSAALESIGDREHQNSGLQEDKEIITTSDVGFSESGTAASTATARKATVAPTTRLQQQKNF